LTFEDIGFNMLEAVFKFFILLQPCFHTHNHATDRTVRARTFVYSGTPGMIRTCGLRIRKPGIL